MEGVQATALAARTLYLNRLPSTQDVGIRRFHVNVRKRVAVINVKHFVRRVPEVQALFIKMINTVIRRLGLVGTRVRIEYNLVASARVFYNVVAIVALDGTDGVAQCI